MGRQKNGQVSDACTKRTLLEAEQLALQSRLRDFSWVRQRVTDLGGDPDAVRQLMVRRGQWIAQELRKLGGGMAKESSGPVPTGDEETDAFDPVAPLAFLPLRAAVFGGASGAAGAFGYSGSVQMPRAVERDSRVPGRIGTSGEITTVRRHPLGGVQFKGRLESTASWFENGPWPSDEPVLNMWSRSWSYLVPFPPPPVDSVLSYGVNVAVYLAADREHGEAQFMSAIGLGHTPSLSEGTDIALNASGGWPLTADLTVPDRGYNGSCGNLFGKTSVRRSLQIGAGQNPAIQMVLSVYGIVGDLVGQEAVCNFNFLSDSLIRPEDANGLEGRISFHYRPIRLSVEG